MANSITEVATVAIPVSDQDEAIAFYMNKLGFELRFDAEIAGRMRRVEVARPARGHLWRFWEETRSLMGTTTQGSVS